MQIKDMVTFYPSYSVKMVIIKKITIDVDEGVRKVDACPLLLGISSPVPETSITTSPSSTSRYIPKGHK